MALAPFRQARYLGDFLGAFVDDLLTGVDGLEVTGAADLADKCQIQYHFKSPVTFKVHH